MSTMRLLILALAVSIVTGCVTTDVREPNNQKAHDRMIREKGKWNSDVMN